MVGSAFQTCARVPLIFHDPTQLEPRVVTEPVGLIDLAPTLLQAAGVPVPGDTWMQGRSLSPYLLTGQRDDDDGVVFTEAGNAIQGLWQRIVPGSPFQADLCPNSVGAAIHRRQGECLGAV